MSKYEYYGYDSKKSFIDVSIHLNNMDSCRDYFGYRTKEEYEIENKKLKEDELKLKENELKLKENELKLKEDELKLKEDELKLKDNISSDPNEITSLVIKNIKDNNIIDNNFAWKINTNITTSLDVATSLYLNKDNIKILGYITNKYIIEKCTMYYKHLYNNYL